MAALLLRANVRVLPVRWRRTPWVRARMFVLPRCHPCDGEPRGVSPEPTGCRDVPCARFGKP